MKLFKKMIKPYMFAFANKSLKKATAFLALLCFTVNSFAVTCSIPGNAGVGTVAAYENGLYPGVVGTNASAGATTVAVGALRSGTAAQAGSLLLVIQMQGAVINSTNSAQYGDGAGSATVAPTNPPGALPTAAFRTDIFGTANYAGGSTSNTAGTYEYVVATGPAAGGSIPLASALVNSYTNQAATATQGQTRYQVVVIPQYSSATYSGTHTIPAWDGSSGGVEAIDVAGALTFSGLTINGNARGFRGGGGVNQNENASCLVQTGAGVQACQDYRSINANNLGGFKGEGIAGTPALVYSNVSSSNTGAANGTDGYPNGDRSRGAPGNAGGGGNQHNAGGGGGGNGGAGGKGGRSWNGNGAPFAAYSGEEVGGYGGASGYNSAVRLVMGGGGGAGEVGGNTSTPVAAGAGGAGGALVIIRAGSIAGTATINVDGGAGIGSSSSDAGGGGGAGGTVMVTTGTGTAAGITVNARGGAGAGGVFGGSIETDGPGGGGGGGQFLSNGGGAATLTGGAAGTISNGANVTCSTGSSCGATAGIVGLTTSVTTPTTTGVLVGYQCLPNITATKTTTTPVLDLLGAATGVANYQIELVNSGGGARGVSIIDNALPPGWTLLAAPTYTYTPAPPMSANNLPSGADNSAVPTINPVAGAPVTSPAVGANILTWNNFFIAPLKNDVASRVRINFTVTVPTTAPVGCFQNPLGFTYLDSTRSLATRTVTPATNNSANRTGTAYSANTTYQTGPVSAVAGSNYSGLVAGSTGEDVCIRPDISLTKTNSNAAPAVGTPYSYTVTARNNGHTIRDITYAADQTSPLTAAAIGPNLTNLMTDTLPAGIQLSAPPTGTNWTCTGGAGDTAFGCSYTGTYPWAAATNLAGTITVPVVATSAACPGPRVNTAVLNQAQFPGNSLGGTNLEFNTVNNTATDGAGITPNCNSSITVTKTDAKTISTTGTLNTYTITVTNAGPAAADGSTISDVPNTGLTCPGLLGAATVACTATNGAQCPGAATVNTASTISYVTFNSGIAVPRLPVTGTLTFNYQCTVN